VFQSEGRLRTTVPRRMTDTTMSSTLLLGRRILVVEDELMIADLWENILAAAGCTVLGPFPRIAPALHSIAGEPTIDAALLDVRLHGETILPVAEALAARDVPFLFATGYGADGVPAGFRDRPILTKPCPMRTVLAAVAQLIAAPKGTRDP
jgi:DNA-binding response OmpR family regulator